MKAGKPIYICLGLLLGSSCGYDYKGIGSQFQVTEATIDKNGSLRIQGTAPAPNAKLSVDACPGMNCASAMGPDWKSIASSDVGADRTFLIVASKYYAPDLQSVTISDNLGFSTVIQLNCADCDATRPGNPASPTIPTTPANPTTPTNPVNPAAPTTPTNPATNPSAPTAPSVPTNPTNPTNPAPNPANPQLPTPGANTCGGLVGALVGYAMSAEEYVAAMEAAPIPDPALTLNALYACYNTAQQALTACVPLEPVVQDSLTGDLEECAAACEEAAPLFEDDPAIEAQFMAYCNEDAGILFALEEAIANGGGSVPPAPAPPPIPGGGTLPPPSNPQCDTAAGNLLTIASSAEMNAEALEAAGSGDPTATLNDLANCLATGQQALTMCQPVPEFIATNLATSIEGCIAACDEAAAVFEADPVIEQQFMDYCDEDEGSLILFEETIPVP